MNMKINNKYLFISFLFIIISGCSLSPGMHMNTKSNIFDGLDDNYIVVPNTEQKIKIESISAVKSSNTSKYKIGKGDEIAIVVWGLQDVFPMTNIGPDHNLRRVDSNGNIFFPFVGTVRAEGRTQDELRDIITNDLSEYFNDPQLDITIARFNSQHFYILGEVNIPQKINITDIPINLSEAIGLSKGLNTNSSDGSGVFIIRQGSANTMPRIFRANMSSPSGFLEANNFILQNDDIVYINSNGTTRWNRVISQFFPFSTFLNSIENLTDSNN